MTGTSDSRYICVTPNAALPIGVYAIASAESPRMAFPLVRVEGVAEVEQLDADPAGTKRRVLQCGEIMFPVRAEVLMALVRMDLRKDKFLVAKDFGAGSLLVTDLRKKNCSLLSLCVNDALQQYAVLVRATAEGSAMRVDAVVYRSGLPGGEFGDDPERTPKVPSDADRTKLIDSFQEDVPKAVDSS